jgi:hypothetical protein
MNDLNIQAPPNIKRITINTMTNKTFINPLLNDYNNNINNPVIRFEKFQREQEKLIKIHNDFQETILKGEKNTSSKNNFKNIDKELFTNESDNSNEKVSLKLMEDEMKEKEKEQNKILMLQKVDPEKEELLKEMKFQSTLYNSKIMESLNLRDKNDVVNLENFEKNIIELGLELTDIDPKLKKVSNSKIGKEILLKKIKGRVKEASEMNFFKENRFGGRIKTQTQNDFVGRFKPALSIETSLMIDEQRKKKKLLNPLEKRTEYEDQRSILLQNTMREKKRKMNELQIRKMQTEYQGDKMKSSIFSVKNLPNFSFMLNYSKEKDTLKERQNTLERKIIDRKKNKTILEQLSFYMIDLVEEIYCYQINKGDNKIYLDDWRNWSSMFINYVPFASAQKVNKDYFELNESLNNDEKEENISKSDLSNVEDINSNLIDNSNDECDLMDYINFRGIYSTSLIPESELNKNLDFFEVMGNDYVPKSQENNSKIISRKNYREYEPKDDDLVNLSIPKEIQKNFILTEILEILFDLKYRNEENADIAGTQNKFFIKKFN